MMLRRRGLPKKNQICSDFVTGLIFCKAAGEWVKDS